MQLQTKSKNPQGGCVKVQTLEISDVFKTFESQTLKYL